MKDSFFRDDKGNLSLGRLLSIILFFICTGIWIVCIAKGTDVSVVNKDLIIYGWSAAIGSKVLSKLIENKKG